MLNLFETSQYPGMEKNKPLTFYMTLKIEGYVLHNWLVDSRATVIVMPKAICDVMRFPLTRASTRVLRLNSTLVKTVEVIKDISGYHSRGCDG